METIRLTAKQKERLKKLCGEEKANELLLMEESDFLDELDTLILFATEGEEYESTPLSHALQNLFDDIVYGDN